jgi:hypothetical protein
MTRDEAWRIARTSSGSLAILAGTIEDSVFNNFLIWR